MNDYYYPDSGRNSWRDVLTDLNDSYENEESIFLSLPRGIRFIAYEWGLSDTVFRDEAWVYLSKLK